MQFLRSEQVQQWLVIYVCHSKEMMIRLRAYGRSFSVLGRVALRCLHGCKVRRCLSGEEGDHEIGYFINKGNSATLTWLALVSSCSSSSSSSSEGGGKGFTGWSRRSLRAICEMLKDNPPDFSAIPPPPLLAWSDGLFHVRSAYVPMTQPRRWWQTARLQCMKLRTKREQKERKLRWEVQE